MASIFLILSILASSILYIYLHKKTHMNLSLLYKDNLLVAFLAFIVSYAVYCYTDIYWVAIGTIGCSVVLFAYNLIQIRFWRNPKRSVTASPQDIVSPADGNVIYINHITEQGQMVAIKNGRLSDLKEISQTDYLSLPCWHIGINMTPFDVHRNASPISGKLLLSKHISGSFHSLKEFVSMTENERHTYVLEGHNGRIGVVQIASRGVRRIDTYVQEGDELTIGDWIGMIRFGSQVDVFLPDNVDIRVKMKDQIYAKKTIIASWK